MSTPFPSLTKEYHSTSYPSISPTRSELSTKGKTVAITGGGSGIGAAIAHAFAAAGSTKIALLGRTESKLKAVANSISSKYPGIQLISPSTDISNQDSVNAAFDTIAKAFGPIHILINNAAVHPKPIPVKDVKFEEWWDGFEVNVKGSFFLTQAFLRQAPEAGAAIINVSTATAHSMPYINGSSYNASKLATVKMLEYVASEEPAVHTVSFHPGIVDTAMNRNGGAFALDHEDLPAHFAVWLTSSEASFLKGKFVWAHWDVEELIARKEEIQNSELASIRLNGISFDDWKPEDMVKFILKKDE